MLFPNLLSSRMTINTASLGPTFYNPGKPQKYLISEERVTNIGSLIVRSHQNESVPIRLD